MNQVDEQPLVGRELDAAVAERVMGWRDVTANRVDDDWITVFGCKPPQMSYPDFWRLQGAVSKSDNGEEKRHVPHYSSDIAAAMKVVDKFLSDGTRVEMAFSGVRWNVLGNQRVRRARTHSRSASNVGIAVPTPALRGAQQRKK